ncbi:DNA adenine methylase [Candidatus Chloroploca sp. Khr17]|uniref:DNA adenine methylase n=1 Tax=Candidatus Chloroploca sp. Khr17 TaxID=2496869 RepID=UPI00101D3150|nr:DNA adenine methylase [Candidatus Chloroploca sp. Khr17]
MTERDDHYKAINSPFKWVGGKSRLRKYIVPLIPAHTCFVDVFAGASWVLFGKPPSPVEVLNDKDEDLITFFRVVKYQPEALIEAFDLELVSRAEYVRLASVEPSQLTDVQRAHRFYYLIMAGWGGELAYPRFQTSVSDGGHGNRLFGALKTLRSRIEPVHQRLRTVIIENLDWRDCLKQYDSPTTVFYVDPPYPGNGCNYAHNMRDWASHYALYDSLKQIKGKWIISSYDIPEIRDIFQAQAYYILPVRSFSGMKAEKNGTSRVENREVLVLNFRPEAMQASAEQTLEQGALKLDDHPAA